MAGEDGAPQTLTAHQVVNLLGSVVFRLVAPDVARTALVGALTDAGLEDLASVVLKHKPPADAGGEDGAGKKGKKRRRGKGGQGDDSEPEGGKKRKRQISLMNLFTPFIFEAIQKDPHHPAFKVPTKTDDEGKEVQVRGGQMTLASSCWRALTEADKARLGELTAPFLKSVNDAILSDEGKPEHLHDKLKAFLVEKKADKELVKIVNRSVATATGHNPSKPPGAAANGGGGGAAASGGKAPAGKGNHAAAATSKPTASAQTAKGGKGEQATASKGQEPKKGAAPAAGGKGASKQEQAQKQKQKEEEERKRKQQQEEEEDDDDDDEDDEDDSSDE